MISLLRRSALSAAASASRRALAAALITSEPLLPATTAPIRPFHAFSAPPEKPVSSGGVWRREIHFSAGALGFRASDAVQAEQAVDVFYDEAPAGKAAADKGLDIAKLGIAAEIVSELEKKGITKLFPIQRAVFEPAMQGRDMIGRAKTGTGKTLAFAIPIMDKIIRFNEKHGRGRNPLALVLAPTRELARQVEKEFRESSRLDTLCVYGGVPIQQQIRTLTYGVDVVVGTPGRIIDLLNRNALNLSEVQFVVLDEADQMLAVGFDEDVEKILDRLSPQRQSMMFSATMPPWIRKLTQKYLKNPVTIDLVGENDQKLAEGITLYSIASDNYAKPSILGTLIKDHAKGGKCIIFTQTKRDADRLAGAMGQSFGCQPLHGDISQNVRERTLAGFRDGRFNILIATDVAARGLDIPNVDLVIHYELPNTSELFVHRSGRTGRAGKKGNAILIYSQEQTRLKRGIEQDVGCRFIELPSIKVEGGGIDMFGGMGGRSDYGGGRRMGSTGFGHGGYGRPRSYDDEGSGRFGGSGFGGGFGNSAPRRSGSYGDSGRDRGGGLSDSGSGRFGSFSNSGFGSSGNSGQGASNSFGGSSSSRRSTFGGTGQSTYGSFGKSGQSGFGGGFGKDSDDDSWPRRR